MKFVGNNKKYKEYRQIPAEYFFPLPIFIYDRKVEHSIQTSFKTLIRKVVSGRNELLFGGTAFDQKQNELFSKVALANHVNIHPEIVYKNNKLLIEYAAVFFEDETAKNEDSSATRL